MCLCVLVRVQYGVLYPSIPGKYPRIYCSTCIKGVPVLINSQAQFVAEQWTYVLLFLGRIECSSSLSQYSSTLYCILRWFVLHHLAFFHSFHIYIGGRSAFFLPSWLFFFLLSISFASRILLPYLLPPPRSRPAIMEQGTKTLERVVLRGEITDGCTKNRSIKKTPEGKKWGRMKKCAKCGIIIVVISPLFPFFTLQFIYLK